MPSLIHELENNEALLLMYLSDELPAEDRLEVEQMLASDAGMRRELAEIQSACEGAIAALARLDADRSAVPAENHAVRQAMRAMKQWQVDRLSRQPVLIAARRRRVPMWAYPLASAAALLIGTIAWWGFGGQFHPAGFPDPVGTSSQDVTGQGGVASAAPVGGSVAGPVSPAPSTPVSPEELTADRLDKSLNADGHAVDVSGDDPAMGETDSAPVNTGDSTTADASAADQGLASAGVNASGDNSMMDRTTSGGSTLSISDAESQARSLLARSDNATENSEIFLTEANP